MSAWGCFKLKKKRIKIFVNKIKRGSLFWKRSHFTTPQFFFFQIKLVCFIFLYKFWWLQSQKTDPELIHDYESPKSKKTPKFRRKTILVTFLVVIHFFQNLPAFEKSHFMRHFTSSQNILKIQKTFLQSILKFLILPVLSSKIYVLLTKRVPICRHHC